jgi:hypothetical protein
VKFDAAEKRYVAGGDACVPVAIRQFRAKALLSISMSAKILTALITLLINIAIGVAIFFVLLLAMNGYSESDATYGLGSYVVLALIVSLLMSTCAAVLVHILMKRQFRGWTAALIAVPSFSIIGGGLKVVCSIIGVAVAEYARVN